MTARLHLPDPQNPDEPGEILTDQTRLILNDLRSGGLTLFGKDRLPEGHEVLILIEYPEFKARGRILWCQEEGSGPQILTEDAYPFRCGIQFIAETDEQKEALKKRCEEIAADFLYSHKNIHKSAA